MGFGMTWCMLWVRGKEDGNYVKAKHNISSNVINDSIHTNKSRMTTNNHLLTMEAISTSPEGTKGTGATGIRRLV